MGISDIKRNRNDSVFTDLFSDKKYVLALYNALHPEDSDTTEDMIEIITLKKILVNGIYNDLGFRVKDRLIILVEEQTAWSVNIIIRMLFYISQTYSEYIDKMEYDLYGSKKVNIPKPELYVIYAGNKEIDKEYISLSEEYFGGEKAGIDIRVKVLKNGNKGDMVYQYIMFTRILNEQIKIYGETAQAIVETIKICKDSDILREYLAVRETEVNNIMLNLFDEERALEIAMKANGKKERAEGMAEGRAELLEQLIKAGFSRNELEKALNNIN